VKTGKVEGRRQRAEEKRSKAEGRRQRAEGKRSKAEGRRQRAEGKIYCVRAKTHFSRSAAQCAEMGFCPDRL